MAAKRFLPQLVASVAAALTLQTPAPADPPAPGSRPAVRIAQGGNNQNPAAAEALHSQMRSVARWLENYCTLNYKFPQQQDEVSYAKSQIISLAPNNPYSRSGYEEAETSFEALPTSIPNQGQSGARLSPADEQRLRLQVDYSLNNYMLKEWVRTPPDSWEAAPGTITAVSNQNNMFVVWGAGADGRPIRNEAGNPVLIVGRWFGSERQDTSTDTSSDTDSSD